jgi:hypothetical protein
LPDIERRRRGIFVEPQPKQNSSPVGAAYPSVHPQMSLLTELKNLLISVSTKMPALTGFEKLNP